MGCSSGRLKHNGDFDASGMALKYLTAGAPGLLSKKDCALLTAMTVVVANLWDVTDGDIDRFTCHLLDSLGSSIPVPTLVSRARQACTLKFLVGAAPVVYGLPVCFI